METNEKGFINNTVLAIAVIVVLAIIILTRFSAIKKETAIERRTPIASAIYSPPDCAIITSQLS